MCHLLLSNSLQKRRKWHQNSYKAFALAGSHAWGAAEEGDVQKVRSKSLVTKLFPLSAACILALGAEGTMASARCYFPKNKPTKVCQEAELFCGFCLCVCFFLFNSTSCNSCELSMTFIKQNPKRQEGNPACVLQHSHSGVAGDHSPTGPGIEPGSDAPWFARIKDSARRLWSPWFSPTLLTPATSLLLRHTQCKHCRCSRGARLSVHTEARFAEGCYLKKGTGLQPHHLVSPWRP